MPPVPQTTPDGDTSKQVIPELAQVPVATKRTSPVTVREIDALANRVLTAINDGESIRKHITEIEAVLSISGGLDRLDGDDQAPTVATCASNEENTAPLQDTESELPPAKRKISMVPEDTADRAANKAHTLVVIGTSQLLKLAGEMVRVINSAYGYSRISLPDIHSRLRKGDAGVHANRVLHVAFIGDAVVGCMSSTFQPGWTERGCGHWGLLAVDPAFQGQGVATVMVRAAEQRIATACDQIQIEFEHHAGDEASDRLKDWYLGKCGFTSASGRRRSNRPGETTWHQGRKMIPDDQRLQARLSRLRDIRAQLLAQ